MFSFSSRECVRILGGNMCVFYAFWVFLVNIGCWYKFIEYWCIWCVIFSPKWLEIKKTENAIQLLSAALSQTIWKIAPSILPSGPLQKQTNKILNQHIHHRIFQRLLLSIDKTFRPINQNSTDVCNSVVNSVFDLLPDVLNKRCDDLFDSAAIWSHNNRVIKSSINCINLIYKSSAEFVWIPRHPHTHARRWETHISHHA